MSCNRERTARVRAARSLVALIATASLWFAVAPRMLAQDAVAQDAAPAGSRPAPESAGPEFRSATEAEQIELLRRLLGVDAPKRQEAEPSVAESEPEPEPVKADAEAPKPAPAKAAPRPAAAKPKAAPKTPPKREAPAKKSAPAAKPAETPPATEAGPAPVAEAPASDAAVAERPAPQTPAAESKPASEPSTAALPPVGTIITEANSGPWNDLLTPSLRWTLQRGGRMEVVATRSIAEEPPRAAATEKYHRQVELGPDKKSLLHYVAGTPFPNVTEEDPDAAVKIIFNFENRQMFDDVDGRNFGCITGRIDDKTGVQVERNYRIGHFRRLYHVGRLIVDPKPVWPTPDGIRLRETLFPINEPFDFKGAGFSYNRYLDPARQDDSWLYYPQTKRVRRLSTAQRSEGVFGQDVDLDSYAGFAGNPAWFDWRLLGKKTLLASFHAIHEPVQWLAPPANFMFDDGWEAREVYVLAARSQLKGYNFSLRVIYVDAETWHIPYTEVYDNDGQLWRAYIQQWKAGSNKPMPYAKTAVYPFPTTFIQALTVFDMQQQHTTRCEFPASDAPNEEMWYYWWGDKDGSMPDDFDVANFINSGR